MADEAIRAGVSTLVDVVDAHGCQRGRSASGSNAVDPTSRDQQILDALVGLTRLVQENAALAGNDGPPPRLTVPASVRYDIAALADTVRSIRSDVRALRRNWAVANLPIRGDGDLDVRAAWPVGAAEAATDTILNAVDRIDGAMTRHRDRCDDADGWRLATIVEAETVRIVEACNAQDVVLRRLRGVVEALVALEPVLDRLTASADALDQL